MRIDAYDQVLGRKGTSALGPQHGAQAKAATAMEAAEDNEPPKLLLLGSDALDRLHAAAGDAAREHRSI